jgi:hypothetical protein
LGQEPPVSQSSVFELAPAFREEADTGGVRLGQFEAMYETLFAESLELGEITQEERERLDMAARALGLDAHRVASLEEALLLACEARAEVTLVDPEDPSTLADRAPPSEAAPPLAVEDDDDERDAYDADHERQLDAREPATERRPRPQLPTEEEEEPTLARPKVLPIAEPLPDAELHARFHAATRKRQLDLQFRTAAVLVQHDAATKEQYAIYERHRATTPLRPSRALNADAWTTHLFHPDEDRICGEIFAIIASAALVGRVSAMRRDGTLPRLDPQNRQDAASSTVSAVRALGWSAATLGMRAPPIHLAPELDTGFEIITAVPPSSRVGAKMLSGQSALALAFACGRHLSWYREEHFVCTLVPSVPYLEDIFLAALRIGVPEISLPKEVVVRADIIAQAMLPCLEPPQIERLRRLVARFLARGGVANLKRWARAAEWTACRTGLLLCGDLATASDVLAAEPKGRERVRQIEAFWASDEATELRRQLGVEITS